MTGRLTAAINWYRANIRMITTATDIPHVSIPVMGVWSAEDLALAEDQMINSAHYVDNTFRYERLDGCGHWIPLDMPETATALLLDFIRCFPASFHRVERTVGIVGAAILE